MKGRKVAENISCTCAVSTKSIYTQLLRGGYIEMMLDAGVRFLELACGPCCAIGQSPATNGVAVRRSGNPNAEVYLVSPESAAATAITGTFASAEDILGEDVKILGTIHEPEEYPVNDSLIIPPLSPEEAAKVEIVKGPNIAYLPVPEAPEENLTAKISLKAGDNVSTDDITPASAEFSSMRSNIPLMSKYCFHRYDPDFAERAKNLGKSIIVGGENYGQGSSREHAAINPMFLGVKCVIAKNIARIHKGNLVNHGIVPLLFENPADYDRLEQGDGLEILSFPEQIKAGRVKVRDIDKNFEFWAKPDMSESEVEVSLDGGQLRHIKKQLREMGISTKD